MKKVTVTFRPEDKVVTGKIENDPQVTGYVFEGPTVLASDGYHTFDELYDHRIEIFLALCKELANARHVSGYVSPVWRSQLHSDGSSFDGWFILGIGKDPGKQITYHLPAKRWNDSRFAETLDRAPKFDGHTSADVITRLANLTNDQKLFDEAPVKKAVKKKK